MANYTYVSKDKLLYFKTLLAQLISDTAAGKVDKVSGKGLSTNDYTAAEKAKLAGIAAGAQTNLIEAIQVNGVTQTATSKTVNISVPTDYITAAGLTGALAPYAKTTALPTKNSQLANDSGYQNATQVNSAISTAIAGVTTFSFVIVTSLPATGESNHIYLVAKSSAASNNAYEEYAYINSRWELIGSTDVDLSGYVKSSDLVEITNAEIDAMFA